MSDFYVQGNKISIDTKSPAFGAGSEGSLYLVDGKLYKIYYTDSLNDGFGNKKRYHQSLLGLYQDFEHFVLPEDLIFDSDGNYVGYVTRLVHYHGKEQNKGAGLTTLDWDPFIENIETIEKEIELLSENRFLTVDLGYHNSIFSKMNNKVYMIDPGRYHHQTYFTTTDYKRRNIAIFNDYIIRMLERDSISFKLVHKNKILPLVKSINIERDNKRFSQYFTEISEEYDSVQDFLKEKAKFLHK